MPTQHNTGIKAWAALAGIGLRTAFVAAALVRRMQAPATHAHAQVPVDSHLYGGGNNG